MLMLLVIINPKLTVVGKSRKPRSIKNINVHNFLAYYYDQQAGWTTRDIFQDWFHLQEKNLPKKVVFVLDNAPSYPSSLGQRTEMFLSLCFPPNMT